MRRILPLIIAVTIIFSGLTVHFWPPEDIEGKLSNQSALTNRSTIVIDGDSNFTTANGVSSGTGTSDDPYIIENWKISATISEGIKIQNTNKHFIIRNCWIQGGWPDDDTTPDRGIFLDKVTNGIITNNLLENNYRGVMGRESNSITLYNNTFNGNADGIGFYEGSRNITIRNNYFNSNSVGVELESDTDLCLIANNSIRRSLGVGIMIEFDCENNIIEYNDCLDTYREGVANDQSGEGIRLYRSSGNIIRYNNLGCRLWPFVMKDAPDPKRDVAACRAIRERVGTDMSLMPVHIDAAGNVD